VVKRVCPAGCRCNGGDDCPMSDDDDMTPQELIRNDKKYKHIIKKLKDGRVVL
jgi:hypothetical protein